MAGYQEILTDPSYAGQIIAMTYPHIGNYGVNASDRESRRVFAEGLVVRELSRRASNWRSEGSLEDSLIEDGVPAITGVDTRRLTRHVREVGAMPGVIIHGDVTDAEAIDLASAAPQMEGRDLVTEVTIDKPYVVEPAGGAEFDIAAYDFGIKARILEDLAGLGARVTVWPARTEPSQVLSSGPDGVFLSNGPGDPAAVGYAIAASGELLGKLPVFGICLGHQIMSLALGARTYKLAFGHHGGNHPVRQIETGRVEVTSQNHGFAVDPVSLGASATHSVAWGNDSAGPESLNSDRFGTIEATHVNLNDGTLEGLRCLDLPAFSVQYHPEAAPGPNDARYLFDRFKSMVEECR